MFGYNTSCPKCKHEFACFPLQPPCCGIKLHPGLNGRHLLPPTQRHLHLQPTPLSAGTGTINTVPSPCASPQVSPSAPLAFVLPPFGTPLQASSAPCDSKPETELEKLRDTVSALRRSGFYYEGLTFQQSDELLKNCKVGTFLVRNSSDPRFKFSLSVQTERGPTSVRLFYYNGFFRLDAQKHLQTALPVFPSVIELVQHYINQSQLCRRNQVFVDSEGKWYSPILLDTPLKKKDEPPSLKHLARLAIHKGLEKSIKPRIALLPAPHTELDLPTSLKNYLAEYPHSV